MRGCNGGWLRVDLCNAVRCLDLNISEFLAENFDFWPKFRFLTDISIFDRNFDFWPKFRFLTDISIFHRNFDFRPKFRFLNNWILNKSYIFVENSNFWSKSWFWPKSQPKISTPQKFGFLTKIWILDQNFNFLNIILILDQTLGFLTKILISYHQSMTPAFQKFPPWLVLLAQNTPSMRLLPKKEIIIKFLNSLSKMRLLPSFFIWIFQEKINKINKK